MSDPSVNENKPRSAIARRFLAYLEIMAGFSVACILFNLNMNGLTTVGRVALCMFCIALPILIAIRVDFEYPPHLFANAVGVVISQLAVLLDVIGFGLLIWQRTGTAAMIYFVGIIVWLTTEVWYGRGRRIRGLLKERGG